jgi:hypothetical protein
MARPETLIPGNCYFSVGFYDNDLVLPMIDTLVYVGQEADQDEGRLWLFKEPESPPSPDEHDPSSEPAALIGFSDRQLHGIVDFDGLMQILSAEVAKFLNDAECASVTMTIRFTDDGLSLGRREGGYEMVFFAHPRHDPHEAFKSLTLQTVRRCAAGASSWRDARRTRRRHFVPPLSAMPIEWRGRLA